MPKIIPGLPTMLTCPLCSWTFEIKPLDPRINDSTLAGVFGVGIMKQQAINQYASTIETALKTHLEEHTTLQWVTKVATLLKRVEELETANAELIKRS